MSQSIPLSVQVFNGKFNWLQYAKEDPITIVFPLAFSESAPVFALLQWTKSSGGVLKKNAVLKGSITNVTELPGPEFFFNVDIDFGYYGFQCTIGYELEWIMRNPQGDHEKNTIVSKIYTNSVTPA